MTLPRSTPLQPALAQRLRHRIASVLFGAPLVALAAFAFRPAHATTPAELVTRYAAQAGATASAERGQRLFTQTHGREWSCSSCHGNPPTQTGRHASTGRSIAPLAPGFNPARFTDEAKVEKWFRRNCTDVIGRECSAGEKADVIAWLSTLKP